MDVKTDNWLTTLNSYLDGSSELLTLMLSFLTLVLLYANHRLGRFNQKQNQKLQVDLAEDGRKLQRALFEENHTLQQSFFELEKRNSGFLKKQTEISQA